MLQFLSVFELLIRFLQILRSLGSQGEGKLINSETAEVEREKEKGQELVLPSNPSKTWGRKCDMSALNRKKVLGIKSRI